ncbi:MAG: hypothetical protein V1489_02280 [Candidatus Liptonbacteria bacterium]
MKKSILIWGVCIFLSGIVFAKNNSADFRKYLEQKSELEGAISLYRREQFSAAFLIFKKLADQSNPVAKYYYAVCLEEGRGTAQNIKESRTIFNDVFTRIYVFAQEGDTTSQNVVGLMFIHGYGVTMSYAEALKWFRQAAEQGYAPAQTNYGLMYFFGHAVEKNYDEAVKWFRKAAQQGDVYARIHLQVLSEPGLAQKYAEEDKWFRKNDPNHHATAGIDLGSMPDCGRSANKNYVETLQYMFFMGHGLLGAYFENHDVFSSKRRATLIDAKKVTPPKPPSNHVNYPQEGWWFRLENIEYTELGIQLPVPEPNISPWYLERLLLLHYDERGNYEILPSYYQNGFLYGQACKDGLFAVIAPIAIFDKDGPIVNIVTESGYASPEAIYINSQDKVRIAAADVSSYDFALAGVATTYVLVDQRLADKCLNTPQSPAESFGSCANNVYTEPFTLKEGKHNLLAYAVDNIGNTGPSKTETIYSDGTPPQITLRINGRPVLPGTTVYADEKSEITMEALDPVLNGVSSGLATSKLLVDISEDECEYSEWSGGVNGQGSCENPVYTGPFTLSEGEHPIYYYSIDNVGNKSEKGSFLVVVK